ncbi:MAG: FAD-dependent oxidoreductase [Gemmatimonadota bacterium]|nr:MAG: FAD-dependent oxidoreductase [Gemmatimonadota bacterium]
METKVAVYICRGCDIGDSLDIEALNEVAREKGAAICREHECLCGDDGCEMIRQDVQDGANALVVAACTPRFKTDTFTFDGCRTERVNLREHVVWSHDPNDEDTQALADDYLRMGLARAHKALIPEPFDEEIDKTILVVGGGVTGIAAALDSAAAGYDVVVVEKEQQLGGWSGKFARTFPHKPPYREPEPIPIQERIALVESNDRIEVHTGATIERIAGQPGQFDVTLKANGSSSEFRVGAIVQATGWKPYDASRLGHLGYGESPNVVTNVELEEMIATGTIKRPGDGKPPRRIAFIQCAGSRDENHLPYCSSVCCRVTIKQALMAREFDPTAEAYVLYKDMRTPGQYEDFYRRAQEDSGIFFTKAEVTGIVPSGDGLRIEAENTLLGDRISLEADLVVLATGMVPNSADGEAIRRYNDAKAIVAKGEAGAQLEAAKQTVEELGHVEGSAILNLDYRQGPDLPVLKYEFPDSHFICFPYETRRTGIYMAGCVRAPNDSQVSQEDGSGAALKVIQSLELASRGEAVHPRWGDTSFPDFFLQRCTQCKRCTEECPFGTLNEDVKGTPQPNLTRCRRCGICMGACPERIISFKDYSVDIISSMIKAVEIPDEFEEKPRILGLLCENDAYPSLDTAGLKRLKHSAFIRFIPVRCLGSVNTVWIADALSRGFDGILLIGCMAGNDYQCHFIRGSELMDKRSENVQEKLKQLALEEERVQLFQMPITDYERLPQVINEFAEQIEEIGLNPFKGF